MSVVGTAGPARAWDRGDEGGSARTRSGAGGEAPGQSELEKGGRVAPARSGFRGAVGEPALERSDADGGAPERERLRADGLDPAGRKSNISVPVLPQSPIVPADDMDGPDFSGCRADGVLPVVTLSGAAVGDPKRATPTRGDEQPGRAGQRSGAAEPEVVRSSTGSRGPSQRGDLGTPPAAKEGPRRLSPRSGGEGPKLKESGAAAEGPERTVPTHEGAGAGRARVLAGDGGPADRGSSRGGSLPSCA